jgi:hypothetical protein
MTENGFLLKYNILLKHIISMYKTDIYTMSYVLYVCETWSQTIVTMNVLVCHVWEQNSQ